MNRYIVSIDDEMEIEAESEYEAYLTAIEKIEYYELNIQLEEENIEDETNYNIENNEETENVGNTISFKNKKKIDIEKLNELKPIHKIIFFMDEVRIPRSSLNRPNKQSAIQGALREADYDVVGTEKILRQKGYMKRKKSLLY